MDFKLHTFDDARQLFDAAAGHLGTLMRAGAEESGAFHMALSGGGTPEQIYTRLRDPDCAGRIPWERLHVYFGDERCVPPDNEASNYRMAWNALLAHVPVPSARVHRMAGERPPQEAAETYAGLLTRNLPAADDGWPRLDLVMLGLGPDGHVASLFPGTDILARDDTPVAAVYVKALQAWRLSLTLPTINHARHVILVATGEGKAETVRRVARGREEPPLPAQLVRPRGRYEWFLDAEAAARL